MAGFDVGTIEGTLTLDRSPFQRGLRDARAEAKKFSSNPIKARLELNDKPFRERLTKVRTAARRPMTTRLELNDKAARTRIDAFRERAKRNISIRVDLDDKAARARLLALKRSGGSNALGFANRAVSGLAGSLSGALGGIPIVGDVIGSALTGATGAAKLAGDAVTQLLGRFSALGSVIPQIGGQVVQLALGLAGMAAAAGGVIIALNAIVGVAIALGGALVALVASFAAAAAGAALLGVAFLGAVAPAVVLGIGLFRRFQEILKARQAHEQQLTQAVQAQKTAEQQRRQAIEQTRSATQNLRTQTVAAYAAMKQSIEDVLHAQNAVANARLGKEGARLNLSRARQDLKSFLAEAGASSGEISKLFQRFQNVDFNPASARGLFNQVTGKDLTGEKLLELRERLFGVKEAVQGVKNADLSYHDSLGQLNKAEATRADYVRRGIKAYAPYRAAIDQVAKAHLRLVRAQNQSTAAQRRYDQALKKLTPTEKGTLSRLDRLVKGFDALAKRFSDPVFRAINDVFDKLSGRGSVFGDVLDKIGIATGDFVRKFGDFIADPVSLRAFRVMGDGAAYLIRQLGSRAFINFLRIMRNLAEATLPSLKRIANDVGNVFAGWAHKTSNVSKFRSDVVIPLVKNFRTWAGLAKDVGGLVVALFRVAAPQGRSLAESLRAIVQRWTRWIHANPEKVRAFFHDAVEKTKEIVTWLRNAFVWLRDHLPQAADKARRAFVAIGKVLGPLLKLIDSFVNKTQGGIIGKFILPLAPRGSSGGLQAAPPPPPGYHYNLGTGKLERDRAPSARPKRPGARTASVAPEQHTHFHAHGIENPDQFLAKSARKLANHPDFRRARVRRLRLAG